MCRTAPPPGERRKHNFVEVAIDGAGFANRTSAAFALDLLAAAVVALIWMTREAGRVGIGKVWRFWVLTLLFGLGGTLPLFLYFRERRLAARQV